MTNIDQETTIQESPLVVVNIVGSGDLDCEIDLEQVVQDVNIHEANYEEGTGSAYLRIDKDSGLVILYRSGKYIIRGGKEFEKFYRTNKQFLNLISELEIRRRSDDPSFKINNLVFVGDLEDTVALEALVVRLGLEKTEFEPEQFPGIVYRPNDFDCVLLIFGSGKVSITGSNEAEEAIEAFDSLKEKANRI